jgi:uncharacterized protein (DUF2141 family)
MHRTLAFGIGLLCVAIFTRLAAAQSPSPQATSTAAQNALEIEVVGMRNDHGEVGCSLFIDRDAFPGDDTKMYRHVWTPIHGGTAVCRYPGIPAGDYAAVVFHDENGNHEFDRNFLGMPKEGFGFSRDAPTRFSAPKFDDADFKYDGHAMRIVVHIRYFPGF